MKSRFRALWPMCFATLLVAGVPRIALGETVTAIPLPALAGGVPQDGPAVAFNGTHHLLVWEESAVIWGAVLDDLGAVVKPPFPIAPPAIADAVQTTPAVAASTGQFLVAWAEDTDASGDWNVRAARVSAAGVVLDASGIDVSVVLVDGVPSPYPGPAPGVQRAPAVAAVGSEFLVVWEDYRDVASGPDILGSAVAADGTVLDQGGRAISLKAGAQQHPALASNGGEYLVAWDDGSPGGRDVYGARVSATGLVGAELGISLAAGDQVRPAVASSDAGWAVAWADFRSGTGWDVVAARVSGAGVADPSGIVIGAIDGEGSPLAVASDGTGYLVVYERGAGAFGKRLGADGVPGAELTIAAAGVASPGQAVAASGYESYLEVHRDSTSGVAQVAAASVITGEPLEVLVSGGGLVTSVPTGITCNPECTAWFETGTSVTLTAAPDSASAFAGWTGCPTPSGPSCSLTLTAATTVTASFALALPGAPGALTYSGVGPSSATLSWTAASNATGYELERAPDVGGAAGTFSLVASLAGTSHLDTPLSANTTYWYRVRATNSAGASDYGSWITMATLPGSPGAPAISDVTATSVTITWTAPDGGADAYDLERASAAGTDWARVATATALTYVDATVAAGTSYQYRVRATNEAGAGAYSSAVSVTTTPAAPGTPVLSAVSATSVTLSWSAPTGGATSYKVERSTEGGPWVELAAGVVSTTYADATLTTNTGYAYRVRATNASGDGAYSAAASVTTLTNVPGAPTFTAITASTLSVSWLPPAGGAASYELDRATSATGTWTALAAGTTATTFADAGLTAGTTYWYRVRAANVSGGWSAYATSSVPTLPAAPGAPTFSSVAATSLTVSWSAVTGAMSYKLERAPDASGVPGTWAQIAAPTGTSHPESGRTANTIYWYRVQATNASGDGAYSAPASVTTLTNVPGAPTFTAITTSTLTVSWQPPTGGAATYDLDRSPSGSGTWTPLATGTAATSFADTGLAAGTTYWYRVRAANVSGGWSAYATSSVATLPGAPGAPTFSAVSATSLTVSWPAVTGATAYKLERAPDASGVPGTWTQIATPSATSHPDSGLSANTVYWYRVRATNASGDGAYSPDGSVATLANPPGTPTFAAITTSSVTVSWQPPSGGAASYDLDRATGAAADWTPLAVATTATSIADSGLMAGTTYTYRVRAANATGVKTAYATASITMLPDAPPAPTFSDLATTSLTVSWGGVTGATSYKLERAPDASGVPGAWTQIAAPTLSTHGDTGLTANTLYWYRVRATNGSGDGAYSPPASVMTLPNAPARPTFSLVTTTALTVSWAAPQGGATSYDVERALSGTGTYTQIATGIPGFSFADTGLTAGTTYVYRVRAVNAEGSRGDWSIGASLTNVPNAPGAPTFSDVSTFSLTVQWPPVQGAGSYHLERTVDLAGQPDPAQWQVVAAGLIEPWYNDALDAPDTTYWYRVRAANEDGHASAYGEYSPASSVTTLANAPGAPTFTSVGATSVTVAWTAPAGSVPSSYDLQRATSASGPWTSITVAGQSYTDTALAAGTTYWYRVAARNAVGQPGLYSASRSVTTLTGAPGAATFSSVTATSVTVTWAAAAGATSYRLERSTGTSSTWSTLRSSIFDVSYTDTFVTPNTTYWYRVSAVNAAGAPGPYSPATTVTTLPGAPGAPTFTAVATTALTLSWTAPAGGAASYQIERATGAGGPWTQVASGLAALSHGDSGLVAGTTYYYRVLAVNSAGAAGLPSASRAITTTADVTSAPDAPAAPSFASVAATFVRVSWTVAANAASYELERALEGGAWVRIAVLGGTSFTDTGRSANTLYRYRVRAVNAAGEGPYSPEASVITAPGTPAAPTFSAVTATSLTVSWMEPTGGATAYTLERATSLAGPWTEIASAVPLRMHVDSGLRGNTSYLYRVRASNAAGALSGYSPPGSVTTPPDSATATPGIPGAPTFTFVTATSLRVSWTAASSATSYAVERSTSELGGWTQIAVVTATSIADGGRSANTTYWYRVRASNAGGFGAFSPASSVVMAPNVPGAPAFASVATTSITVSWAPPAGGASSYELERATSGTGPWSAVAATDPMVVDTGLAANTTYYYRVRAKSSAGVVSAYSPIRYVTTAPDAATSVPGAPGAPTYTSVTATAVKLLWAPALGATSYDVERAAGATAPGTFSPIKTALASTAYSDFGRSPNTRYWYRVRGVGPGGNGPYSAASSVLTAPGVPGAPAFALIGTTTLTVTWAAPSGGAASYKVERATSPFGPWTSIASGVPTTSFSDGGLLPSTTYYYRIRATNADGLDGVVSSSRSTMTMADASTPIAGAPGAPEFTNVRATSVDLGWTAGTAATSYKVERAAAATGPFTLIASATGTTFSDAPLSANTTYWYRVRSANAAGDGLASEARSVMTAPNPPGAPTFSGVEATAVTVSWTAPAGGAASYALERAAGAIGPWTQVASGLTSPSYGDTGLDAGTTYHYRVRAANGADPATYGGYSAVRNVTTASATPAM